ncbi:MAG TPA: DUF4389 domain-containing protein [Dehalococcoidia bacterium]|nr:DUF4389 domain-containing protein [Dehalococcoidia bacterium]
MEIAAIRYPVTLEVDYPERQSRWKTLFRLFLAIPVFIFAVFLCYASFAVAVATWLAIIVSGRIPRWMFDFQVRLIDWQARAQSYAFLLTDTYPAFEGLYPVRFNAEYPERVSRWKVILWKYLTALPHTIVLQFLWIGAFFSVIVGWFAVLFTGHFPKGLHGFVVGVGRWNLRVQTYVLSLTDEFPPFSLSGVAGPAGRDTYVISSVIGGLLAAAWIGVIAVGITVMPGADRFSVSYAALEAGTGGMTVHVSQTDVSLLQVTDPADSQFPLLVPRADKRFVAFQLEIGNDRGWNLRVRESDFRLKDSEGDGHDPTLAVVGGSVAPVNIPGHSSAAIYALFEIDEQAQPTELRYRSPPTENRKIIWEFE